MNEMEADDVGEGRVVTVVPSAGARGAVVRKVSGGGLPVRYQGAAGARPWAATGMMDVEDLAVWAYRDQKVERGAASGLYGIEAQAAGHVVYGRSSDGCAALADIAHMGCRVDRGGVVISDHVHPAAEAVANELNGIEDGRLVGFFARLGGRPDAWRAPDAGKWWRAVQWRKPWVEAEPELFRGRPVLCEVTQTRTLDEIVQGRVEYERWWLALDRLAWALSMRSLGFAVMPPQAPREPWAGAAASA